MSLITKLILSVIISLALIPDSACSKKEVIWQPTDSLGKVNKWVHDSMQLYYYWSAEMPANPDYSLPTQDFFRSLLSSKDRFSWMSNDSAIISIAFLGMVLLYGIIENAAERAIHRIENVKPY